MKNLEDKKILLVFFLLFLACYFSIFALFPLIKQYYHVNYRYSNKVDTVQVLKMKLNSMKKIKLIKFKVGYHKLSTYLLTILSYMSYLQNIGLNVNVKLKNVGETRISTYDPKLAKLISKNRNIFKIQNAPRFKNRFGHADFIGGSKIRKFKYNDIKKYIAYERLTIILNKVPNINVIFSLLKIFRLFPIEIKKISISTDRNIGVIFNLRLINLSKFCE